jgi:glycerophosphoryl diester phosphodiesterase
VPEQDVERTDPETGKTSSVHFLHFPFTDDQVAAFRAENVEVSLEIKHPAYRHSSGMTEEMRAALASDFDTTLVH